MDRKSQSAAANRIFDRSGVPPAHVDSALKKMLPSDPSMVLENYDAILAAIRERGPAHAREPT